MDFTIVIAHRGNPLGLWATIHSCEADLDHNGFDYNYVVVSNGTETIEPEAKVSLDFLSKAGKLKHWHHSKEPMSPPSARQLGTKYADGDLLCFFDNHCLVGRDYFRRVIIDFGKYGMDMLHSTTVFYTGESTCYQYKLRLEKNFWAEAALTPEYAWKPYRIAAGGHGGFVVKRSVWEEVGGYWDGFEGYGGEEMYFDLKMALLGKINYIDPKLFHYHFTGTRSYPRHYSDNYFRNMMMTANIIGGEEWMSRVCGSFIKNVRLGSSNKTMFDLMLEAFDRSKEHAEELSSKRQRTLNEQLEFFKKNQIAYR